MISSILLGIFTYLRAKEQTKIQLGNNKKILLLGDSHPACGIMPFDECIHLAKSGEAWYYQVVKGRCILDSNPQVKTVLIEFNLGQLSPVMEKWILDDEHVERAVKSYFSILTWDNWQFVLKNNPIQTIQSYWLSQKRILAGESFNTSEQFISEKEWGGFEENFKICWDSLKMIPKASDQIGLTPQTDNIEALQDFIQWCTERGIQVVLLRCPQHRSSCNNQESALQQIRKTYFGSIPFLDFRDYPFADSLYLDREHLNARGAREFTPILQSRLQQIGMNELLNQKAH